MCWKASSFSTGASRNLWKSMCFCILAFLKGNHTWIILFAACRFASFFDLPAPTWNNLIKPSWITISPLCVSLQWCTLWWSFSHGASLKERKVTILFNPTNNYLLYDFSSHNIVQFSIYLPRGWDHRWAEATVLTYRAPRSHLSFQTCKKN